MRALGRWLQIAALILLPLGMIMELTGGGGHGFGVRNMLMLMGFGLAAFYIGRIVEGYARN